MNLGQPSDSNKASAAASQKKGTTYRIEGENVTCHQIAERLGINYWTACSRMRKLRGASGPITWARLAA